MWSRKGTSDLLLVILNFFCRKRVLIALQLAHATSILKCVVTTSEGSFKFLTLSCLLSFFLFDMLLWLVGALEIIVPLPLCDPLWVFFFNLVQTWVHSLCYFFPLLLGVLFNGSCQGFIILVFIFELCSTWSHALISCLKNDFFCFFWSMIANPTW